MVDSVVHQDACYKAINKLHIGVNYSCNKLHATHEIVNIERIKSRSLRDSVVHQDARYNMESRSRSVQLVARNE